MDGSKIRISSIAAMARNRVIGIANGMAWYIPEDFKYFKKTTLGHPVIMGRHTYETFSKPLSGRPNIVISRSFSEPVGNDGPFFVQTIGDAFKLGNKMAHDMGAEELFIIGGGRIYEETLPVTERLYLTIIDKDYEGDTYFPDFDWNDWNVVSEDKREGDPPFTFYVLERK